MSAAVYPFDRLLVTFIVLLCRYCSIIVYFYTRVYFTMKILSFRPADKSKLKRLKFSREPLGTYKPILYSVWDYIGWRTKIGSCLRAPMCHRYFNCWWLSSCVNSSDQWQSPASSFPCSSFNVIYPLIQHKSGVFYRWSIIDTHEVRIDG